MEKTSTPVLAVAAVLAWALLGGALAGIEWGQDPTVASPARTPLRLLQLAGAYGIWLLLPLPVVAIVFRLAGRDGRRSIVIGLRVVLVAWIGAAVLWAGIGLIAAANGENPWEALPEVTPPYLERFIAEHPQIEVEKVAGSRWVYISRRGQKGVMRTDGNLLAGTQARLERCPKLPDPDEIGGLPMFPKSTCRFTLTLARPGLPPRAIHVIDLPVESDLRDRVRAFYLGWAQAQKAEAGFSGISKARSQFRAKAAGGQRQWDFLLSSTGISGDIEVERGGKAVEWPLAQQMRR